MSQFFETITISPMTRADVPEVHALECMSFSLPWDMESYYGEAENPSAIYLVARADGQMLGFGGMWAVADEAHIVTLAVHPAYRRHGIGRTLLAALLEEARRRGIVAITLEVRVGNTPARNLYASFGFESIAIRKHYYPDNDEDAAVMELRLA